MLFTNLSGDPSQDYFADGITENLTTDPQRLGQEIGYHLKRGRSAGHHRPFLSYNVPDIATDQVAQVRLGLSRKGSGL